MTATFELNCPHCDRLYTLSVEKAIALASRSIRCKQCGQAFRLPTEQEIRASAEEPGSADQTSGAATPDETTAATTVGEVEAHDDAASGSPEAVGMLEQSASASPLASTRDTIALPSPAVPPWQASADVAPSATGDVPTAPPQVIYAMPPQTVSDIASIRRWTVVLGVLGLVLVTANVVLLVFALVRSR